jgi:hypothetical protein
MGEAKRRRRSQQREWIKLFGDRFPTTATISRPGKRPETAQRQTVAYLESFMSAKLPPLCFDTDCDHEFHSPPEVLAFLMTDDDPSHATGMAICPDCAKKGDSEIFDVMRRVFRDNFGIGLPLPSSDDRAEIQFIFNFEIDRLPRGMKIAAKMQHDGDKVHRIAVALAAILEAGKLPRFVAFWRGVGNCHAIVRALYEDLKSQGGEDFTCKTGFSSVLKRNGEPVGLHSWIEIDGVAIEASGGAYGHPIKILRSSDYYDLMKMKDVRLMSEEFPQMMEKSIA